MRFLIRPLALALVMAAAPRAQAQPPDAETNANLARLAARRVELKERVVELEAELGPRHFVGPIITSIVGFVGFVVTPLVDAAANGSARLITGIGCVYTLGTLCSEPEPDHTALHWGLGVSSVVLAAGIAWLIGMVAYVEPIRRERDETERRMRFYPMAGVEMAGAGGAWVGLGGRL